MMRRVTTMAGLAGMIVLTLACGLTTAVSQGARADEGLVVLSTPPIPPVHQPVFLPPPAPPKQPVAAAPKPAPGACPAAPALPTATTKAAHAAGAFVDVYPSPTSIRPLRTLLSPTRDWQRLVLGVREERGEWLLVQYNERPNGVTGWIKKRQVVLTTTDYRILVERCAKRLSLFRNGQLVMQEPVAVGTSRTPTPLGDFYVDFIEKKANPRGSYGPYMLSVSGFSEVYMSFGKGGVGQIAIHGTNARHSVGKAASNGCIRMYNDAVSKLAYLVPSGTPVTIVA